MSNISIEEYSEITPQYYTNELPSLLENYLESFDWHSLLDCGCGDGNLLYSLKSRNYLDNKEIYAIDLSKRRIKLVQKIDSCIISRVDNVENLNTIDNEAIDFYISTQVIEHVEEKKMIRNIERVVRKNGLVYLSTVYKKRYGWYFYKNNGKRVLDPTHLREYTEDRELLELFSRDSFQLLENRKTLFRFPLFDFFKKRVGIRVGIDDRDYFDKKIFRLIRKIKLPIPGYYNWEIVFRRI